MKLRWLGLGLEFSLGGVFRPWLVSIDRGTLLAGNENNERLWSAQLYSS